MPLLYLCLVDLLLFSYAQYTSFLLCLQSLKPRLCGDFQIGIGVANAAAENARDTEIFLNVEISEDFSNNINNFSIIALSLPR